MPEPSYQQDAMMLTEPVIFGNVAIAGDDRASNEVAHHPILGRIGRFDSDNAKRLLSNSCFLGKGYPWLSHKPSDAGRVHFLDSCDSLHLAMSHQDASRPPGNIAQEPSERVVTL
jgi:hypothetical protein